MNRLRSYIDMTFERTTNSIVFVVCVFTITANSPQLLNLSIAFSTLSRITLSTLTFSFRKPGHQDKNYIDKEIR